MPQTPEDRRTRYHARKLEDPEWYAGIRATNLANLRAWRKANPEKYRAQWGKSNRKRNPKQVQAWRRNHPEEARALRRKNVLAQKARHRSRYRKQLAAKQLARIERIKADPVKYAEYRLKRTTCTGSYRAKKRKAPGSHTIAQWLARVDLYGWHCFYCCIPLSKKTLTKDHRIPVSKGGSEWPANLIPACKFCNQSKGNRKKPTTYR